MASGTSQFANQQEVLLSVGPFQGLDTTTSPYYVAPNNAVSTQNVAVNRNYASYVTAQGRVANYFNGTLPSTPIGIGIYDGNAGISGGTIPNLPGVLVYCTDGNVYIGTNQGGTPILVPGWSSIAPGYVPANSGPTQGFVFTGSLAFLDSQYNVSVIPQMIILSNTFTQAITWGVSAPGGACTVAAGAAGNLTGTYYYAITFVVGTVGGTTLNSESSTSPFSAALVLSSQNASLSAIPVSASSAVTARNIYRFGGTIGGTPLLVGTITDNVTTTFTDNTADSAVTGQQLILRQDTAPAGGWAAIAYHKSRMWGFGSQGSSTQSDLWYSNYDQPTSFNSVTQVIDCGSTVNDPAVGLASLESILIAFKQRTTWVCYGDTQNDFVTRRVASIGCVNKGTIATGYGRVFWLSAEGVYAYDGSSAPVNISDGGVAQGGIRSLINAILSSQSVPAASTGLGLEIRGFVSGRTYYVSVYCTNGAVPSQTFGYDTISGGWTTYSWYSPVITANPAMTRTFFNLSTGLSLSLGYPLVLGASVANNGQLDQWLAAETDLGNPVVSNWTTGTSDAGAPGVIKEYRFIEVVAPYQSGSSISVTLTLDPGSSANVFGPHTVNLGSGPTRHRISLPKTMTGYEAQLLISGSTTQKTIVDRVTVHGYIKRQLTPNVGNA